MADRLRRSLAPLTDEAWALVDEAATRVLKWQLSARTIVDFDGPHGPDLGALNLGRLEIAEGAAPGGIPWGLRRVQPLVEVRVPAVVPQMELDNVSRGSKDPDLGPLEEAAQRLALFEETAIYAGFAAGGMRGILEESPHDPVELPADPARTAHAVAEGLRALVQAGVGGPYTLVLGSQYYYPLLEAGEGGFPPRRIIRDMLGGEILWSPALEGGVLLSTRGGDFELVVGDDISVGYAMHDRENVELYLLESFTFRVIEPAAAVGLGAAARGG